jgi:hypothetical protein
LACCAFRSSSAAKAAIDPKVSAAIAVNANNGFIAYSIGNHGFAKKSAAGPHCEP